MISAPVMSAAQCIRLRQVPPPWSEASRPSAALENMQPRLSSQAMTLGASVTRASTSSGTFLKWPPPMTSR